MSRTARLRLALFLSLLGACGGRTPGLDTSCPGTGRTPAALFARMAERGIAGPPDRVRVRIGGEEVAVGWKNLLSGRQLTLSCAYRQHVGGWRLLRARVDEGTHTLHITSRAQPPALVYRDAVGRLLEELAVEPLPDRGWTP
jgi:hypothetical protein